jgi:hypothetical protein
MKVKFMKVDKKTLEEKEVKEVMEVVVEVMKSTTK